MIRRIDWKIALIAIVLISSNAGGTTAAAAKAYLTYETFKSLVSLCPEVKDPSLAGLSPAGQELWSKGQMRIPSETHLFEGDFNDDAKPEVAMVITSGGKNYLIVAEKQGASWHRKGFVQIAGSSIRGFNGRAFVIDEKTFVAWDGKRYNLERGPLALYCNGYDSPSFMGVTIKLTYVGPQNEPYPGLLIASYYRWPDLNKFKTYRKSSVSYANDDIPVLWHLAVSPEDLRNSILALSHSSFIAAAEDRNGTEGKILHSLSILDEASSTRPNHYEVFLKGNETVEWLSHLARRLEKGNPDGAKLLREYAKMFGN